MENQHFIDMRLHVKNAFAKFAGRPSIVFKPTKNICFKIVHHKNHIARTVIKLTLERVTEMHMKKNVCNTTFSNVPNAQLFS